MFEFAEMLAEFGIPLEVYNNPTDGHNEHGQWIKGDIGEPTLVTEPLVVPSSQAKYADLQMTNEGGKTVSYDLLWYTTLTVPMGTKITNPRTGHTYEVVNDRDYQDYSDVTCYEVKGVSNHGQ